MFTHYLITRFNIKITGAGPETLDSAIVDQQWLQERFKLFKTVCGPSVLEQSNTNFTWLIYFDPTTHLEELAFIKDSRIAVEFIIANDYTSMLQDILFRIKSAASPYVITSRLDNDDVISADYIQMIQQNFIPGDKIIINPLCGFSYYSKNQLLTKWNKRFNNQFTSIIEQTDAEPLYSIYGFPHWRPPVEARIINVGERAYWLYWRHDHNYSNQLISGIPVLQKSTLRAFPISVRTIKISKINTIRYIFQWFPGVLKRRLNGLFSGMSGRR